MKIHSVSINEVVLKEVGIRVKNRRISMGLTQKELAEEADVALKTISNLENGANVSLFNLVSVLRVLRLLDNINLLIPVTKFNPFDVLELGKKRERVRKSKKEEPSVWKWGD